MATLEERIRAVEALEARVRDIESRAGRAERIMLEVQGEVRRMERTFAINHDDTVNQYRRIEMKVDKLLAILGREE